MNSYIRVNTVGGDVGIIDVDLISGFQRRLASTNYSVILDDGSSISVISPEEKDRIMRLSDDNFIEDITASSDTEGNGIFVTFTLSLDLLKGIKRTSHLGEEHIYPHRVFSTALNSGTGYGRVSFISDEDRARIESILHFID